MIRYLLSILGIGKKGVAQINQRTVPVCGVANYQLILHKNGLFFVSSNYQARSEIGITMLAGISPNLEEPSGWQLHFVAGNREVECEKLPPETLVQVLDVSYKPIGNPRNINTVDGTPIADLIDR